MVDSHSARIISFPDLPPKGSPGSGGKRATLLGPEQGTQFDMGQRLFAFYGSGDVFDYGLKPWRIFESSVQGNVVSQWPRCCH